MVRTRYIGDQQIECAFDQTSHHMYCDEDHGLMSAQIAIPEANRQFGAEAWAETHTASNALASVGAAG